MSESAVGTVPFPLTQGGTNASLTASNGGIFYSTASAGAILAGTATAGQMLRSGASTTPAWSTATYPATAGTSGKVLISDGTNIVSSTPTFPNASATSGKFIQSDGTNWVASTPTLPSTAGTSGNVLTSDGTNWTSSAAAASGWVLIQRQSASASSTLVFSTGITSTYNNYVIVIDNYKPATNATNLTLVVSADGGSNYTTSNYNSGINQITFNGTTNRNYNSSSAILIFGSVGNANTCGSATVYLCNITS
jgi:hypothetical protein